MSRDGAGKADGDESASRDALVVGLAQSFSDRHRRGERPTIEEYVAQHPDLEAEIRELFPMLCVLEDLGPAAPERDVAPGSRGGGPPRQLGEYRILREIGRGGMGVVYEAEQESLKRRVALKVLPFQSFQDEHQLERFRRESQAAARLHHTNIVPVFGVGEDQGVHYYVMQFIRGQTLADILQDVRRLRALADAGASSAAADEGFSAESVARTLLGGGGEAPEPAQPAGDGVLRGESTTSLGRDPRGIYCQSIAKIALQVADGLAYAHNEGVLHRDIKPSNLLLDLKGTVWITDFGLAKVQDSGEITVSGSLVGTIRYMAPERFRGAGDAKSDVYSLGITLYELLTLRPAFAASDRAEVMRDVTSRDPPPPRRLDPSIPRDLETIVLKAIAKEPIDRYSSAAALADDLLRFIHHEPVSARRTSAPERLWRWSQRNRALAAFVGVSALLLFALAVGGMVSAAWYRAASDQAQARLVQSKLEEGRALRLSREPGARPRSLAALREAVTPETTTRVRNEAIGSLALVDLEEVYRRDVNALPSFSDSSLQRLAVALPDGGIEVFEGLDGQDPIARLPGGGPGVHYAFLSPGGRYLAAFHDGGGMEVWDVDRQERVFATTVNNGIYKLAFDPTGERFAYLRKDGAIAVCSLPDSTELKQLEEKWNASSLEFDQGGSRLAATGVGFNASTVLIFDADTGKVLSRLHHAHGTRSVAWHPSGRRIAVSCDDYKVHLWDTENWTRLGSFDGHRAEVVRVAFSHGGRFLASSGWDNRTILWEAATGDMLAEAAGWLLGFSEDDRHLGFDLVSSSVARSAVGLWRLSGGDCYRALPAPAKGKSPVDSDISPDGLWLAAACAWEGIRIWNMESLDDVHELRAGTVWSLRFARDGSALWTAATEGLYRWPLARKPSREGWSLGPPERIAEAPSKHLALSRDGRLASQVTMTAPAWSIVVRDLAQGGKVLASFTHAGVTRSDLSPSGRWLVSTTFHGKDVRVWNVADGSLAHAFQVGTATASFSPDGRWLAVVTGTHITIYEAGSWSRRHQIPKRDIDSASTSLAFTADGRHLAACLSRSLVALLRVEDGTEEARFEAPTGFAAINSLSFSEDQRFLAAASVTNRVLVWDLGRLRRELRARELDWFPDEPAPAAPRSPQRLQVDTGSLAAGVPPGSDQAYHKNLALNGHSLLVELDPSIEAYRSRAAAFERVGDYRSALADLNRVLQESPDDAQALTRRAVAHDRLGARDAALEDANRVIGLYARWQQDPTLGIDPSGSIRLEALRMRARSRANGGLSELEGALSDWRELLTLVPVDPEASAVFGWLWMVKRCLEGGAEADAGVTEDGKLVLAWAERAYAAASENGGLARNLGAVYFHLGRLSEARPLLEKARRLDQRLYSATLYLAMIEHSSGNPQQARELFEAASLQGRTNLPEGSSLRQYFEVLRSWAERTIGEPAPTAGR